MSQYIQDGFEINLSQETVDNIVNTLLDTAEEPIKDIIEADEEILRKAAFNFLTVVKYEEQRIQQLQYVLNEKKQWENLFNKQNKNLGENLSQERHKQIEYKNFTDKINSLKKDIQMQRSITNVYKAGLAFQDIMNKALGQDPVLVFVSNTSKESAAFKVPLREAFSKGFLKTDISSDGKITMRFRTPFSTLNKYAKDVDSEIEKIDNGRGEQDTQYLDKTYREILRRFNKYKILNSKSKYVSVILWKKLHQWKKMLPSSRGDIAEAYADYYISDINSLMTGNLESDIDLFMTYIEKVDNARGRLIGDVVKKNSDGTTTEYAIKSASASVESLDQMLEMANSVLNASDGQVREILLQIKQGDKEAGVQRNVIENLISADLIRHIGKEIKGSFIQRSKNFSI